MKIIIVGAGITGLAAANRLREIREDKNIDINFIILEGSSNIGGNITTFKKKEILIEEGPDSFITSKPYGLNLCNRLGIGDELIPTSEINRRTLIYINGKLSPIPQGFILLAPTQIIPFLASPILSIYGKIRTILEIFIPQRKNISDESLYSFIKRRFGKELYENVAQPLIGGIYTSDPYKLSIKSAVPNIYNLELKYRSVILGLIKQYKRKKDSGARYSEFVTFRNGMNTLVNQISSRIPNKSIKTDQSAKNIFNTESQQNQWKIETGTGSGYFADGIILATPSYKCAEILKSLDSELSEELLKIEFASSAIIILVYKKTHIKNKINGFGFVVPIKEHLNIIACSFSSEKFEGRAPNDLLLTRCFVGGALNEDFLNNSDQTILDIVKNELGMILDVSDEPVYEHIKRYPKSMPQYNIGHEEIVLNIKKMISRHKNLKIAGNSYEGVGIPDCIRSGESAAENIVEDIMRNS